MIAHLDMDCFYASVELKDKPYLKEKPVAVGGSDRDGGRGVITTCNYVAREFGVRSAMSGFLAKEKCPQLVFLPLNFDKYRSESRAIRELIESRYPKMRMVSIDEAYIELSEDVDEAIAQARELRELIFQERELPCSVGLAPTKTLAKIASDWRKPDALFVLREKGISEFMAQLSLSKIPGIGSKTQERLKAQGFEFGRDIQQAEVDAARLNQLHQVLGVTWTTELRDLVCGRVKESSRQLSMQPRERKSTSVERTLHKELMTFDELRPSLKGMLEEIHRRLEGQEKQGKDASFSKVFVKLKFANFTQTTREKQADALELRELESLLWEAMARSTEAVRLLGLGVRHKAETTSLRRDPRQLPLFPESVRAFSQTGT